MPTVLSDPPQGLYLVLIAAAVVAAVPLARNQDRRSLIRFAAVCLPLALLALVDRLVESPREEATRKVLAMAEAATAADGTRFVDNLSPSFRLNTADRDKVRTSGAWGLVRQHQARIAVWGYGRDDAEYRGDEVVIGFYAKAQTPRNEALIRYCKATFVRDPDGQYRVRGIEFYTPGGLNARTPDPIPGFP